MINASNEAQIKLSQKTNVLIKVALRLPYRLDDIELTGDDIMMGGFSLNEATSSTGTFDIGAAIISKATLTLNNYDERFSDFDFTGSRATIFIGVELEGGRIEWIQKGVFNLEQPDSYSNTISLTLYDNMSKLERPYSEVNTKYPASLRTIAIDICQTCGVELSNLNFDNSDLVVPHRPESDSLDCIHMMGYIAQASGNFVKATNDGRIRFGWYDLNALEGEDWLDGGIYDDTKPYATGDNADAGMFNEGGYTANGGEFALKGYAIVSAISSSTICTDDVVITGLRVTAQDEVTDNSKDKRSGETVFVGEEGYVLAIKDNPLIQFGQADEVARRISPKIVLMKFRPFTISALGNPLYEAGDAIVFIDARQNLYTSYITNQTYKAGSYESFSCGAETPARKMASSFNPAADTIKKIRDDLIKEVTDRELAVKRLEETLGTNKGLFMTTEAQPDGGIVYYMHNLPTLGESDIVWKMTADAIGVSTDGGKTYPYGLDVSGTAILERIYTVGLDADYIRTGTLAVKKGDKTVFSADMDTGDVYIDANSFNSTITAKPTVIQCESEELIQAYDGNVSSDSNVYAYKHFYKLCIAYVDSLDEVANANGGMLYVFFNSSYSEGTHASVTPPRFVSGKTVPGEYIHHGLALLRIVERNSGDYLQYGLIAYPNMKDYTTDWTKYNKFTGGFNHVKPDSSYVMLIDKSYERQRFSSLADSLWIDGGLVMIDKEAIADASEIKQSLNNITLSVKGVVGNSASISMGIGDKSIEGAVESTKPRQAFADDSSYIDISAGKVTFDANTFVFNGNNFSLDKDGLLMSSGAVFKSVLSNDTTTHVVKIENGHIFFSEETDNSGAYIRTRGTANSGILEIGAKNLGLLADRITVRDWMKPTVGGRPIAGITYIGRTATINIGGETLNFVKGILVS